MLQANVTTQNNFKLKWKEISWREQDKIINNLRQRIYRASEAGDLKRVRNLQKLMLKSKANKLVAIRKVTQLNQGKFSPGVDNKIVRSDRAREKLYQSLLSAKLEDTLPVKRIYIPKKKGKRPLGLPTIFDRCMQAIVKNALEPYWEAKFEPISYGFRPGRSAHDAIQRIFCIANSKSTRKWVLDADIKGAFDNISHEFLVSQLNGFPGISWIKCWLKAGFIENSQWHSTLTGTPQGGIISPLLANIALHGMESVLGVKYHRRGSLLPRCTAIVRYADDFVVFHETREGCEIAKAKLTSWLAQRGLQLSEEKTQIRHLTEGFDFLGFNIRHYPITNRKLPYIFLTKPSKTSIKEFRQQIKYTFKQAQQWPIQNLIHTLNLMIRGWCNYFRIGSSKSTFALLDHWMWIKQQRFVAKRHPNKSWRWRYNHYWGEITGRKDKWILIDKISHQHLLKLAWTSIRRHILVKGDASPDNPKLRDYWRKRQNRKLVFEVSKLLEPNAG